MPKITTAAVTIFMVGGLALAAVGCSNDDDAVDGTDPTTETTTAEDSTETSVEDTTETSEEG